MDNKFRTTIYLSPTARGFIGYMALKNKTDMSRETNRIIESIADNDAEFTEHVKQKLIDSGWTQVNEAITGSKGPIFGRRKSE